MAEGRVGHAKVRAELEDRPYRQGLDRLERETGRSLDRAGRNFDKLGRSFQRTGTRLSAFLTAPILGAGAAVVAVAGQFESSMNRVSAISGATGEDLERLKEQARELGSTTQFSASQAADGMTFLAQAGFDVNEVMDAMPGVLQLAAAGQLDLASAADLASNVLTGFGLEASEVGRVNDVLAKASNSANTNVSQLGAAMSYVAPVAAGMGISVEEASAAVGLLSDAGIQGQRAGTSLRGILSQLTQKSDELGISLNDAEGNMLPFVDILAQLEENGLTAAEAIATVGTEAGPGLIALLSQGTEKLRELSDELENAGGTAETMAEKQMEGFLGKMKELRSAGEELAIAIGDAGVLGAATDLAEGLTGLVRRFGELEPAAQRTIVLLAGAGAALGPTMIVLGTMIRTINTLKTAWVGLRTAGLLPLIGAGAGGLGVLAAVAAGFNGIAYAVTGEFPMEQRIRGINEAFAEFFETISTGEGRLLKFATLLNSLNPFDVMQGRGERDFFKDVLGFDEEELREVGLALDQIYDIPQTRGFGIGTGGEGGGGGGGGRSAPATPAGAINEETEEALVTLNTLQDRLGTLQEAFAEAGTQSERVSIADDIREVEAEIEAITSLLDTAAGGGAALQRTARDVFTELETAGIAAERRAQALGGTIEDRMESVRTRAGLVSQAINELLMMGFSSADDQVQYLVERLQELRGEIEDLTPRRLPVPEATASAGTPTRESIRDVSAEAAARADAERAALNDVAVSDARREAASEAAVTFWAEVRRQAETDALARGVQIRLDQDARPGIAEAREPFFGQGAAGVLTYLQGLPAGASRPTDGALSEGELLARQAEMSFDEYLASMPDAATDLSVSAEELSAAAARLTLTAQQDTVLGALGDYDPSMRTGSQYGERGSQFEPLLQDSMTSGEAELRAASEELFDQLSNPQWVENWIRKLDQASEEKAQKERQSAVDFGEQVIDAGSSFVDAISAFQRGDISGGIGALGGLAGGIANLIPGGSMFSGLLESGFGLLGGLAGLLGIGGGRRVDEEQSRELAARQSRSVPAININYTVEMHNVFEGGPQQPQIESALLRVANQSVETFMTRTRLVQRIEALEGGAV